MPRAKSRAATPPPDEPITDQKEWDSMVTLLGLLKLHGHDKSRISSCLDLFSNYRATLIQKESLEGGRPFLALTIPRKTFRERLNLDPEDILSQKYEEIVKSFYRRINKKTTRTLLDECDYLPTVDIRTYKYRDDNLIVIIKKKQNHSEKPLRPFVEVAQSPSTDTQAPPPPHGPPRQTPISNDSIPHAELTAIDPPRNDAPPSEATRVEPSTGPSPDSRQGPSVSAFHSPAQAAPAPSPPSFFPSLPGFIGRKSVLTRLSSDISSTDSAVLLVTGPPGIGKTALLAHLHTHFSIQYGSSNVHSFFPPITGSFSADSCLSALCHSLATSLGLPPSSSSRSTEGLVADLHTLLHQRATITKGHEEGSSNIPPTTTSPLPHNTLIIIIDAIDQSRQPDFLMRCIPSPLPQGVYFILSSRYGTHLASHAAHPDALEAINLDPTSEDNLCDAVQFLRSSLPTVPENTLLRVAHQAGGNFLILSILATTSHSRNLSDDQLISLTRDLGTGDEQRLYSFYHRSWDLLCERFRETNPAVPCSAIRDVLGILAIAFEPLSLSMIHNFLAPLPSASSIHELFAPVRQYVLIAQPLNPRPNTTTPHFYLFHPTFRAFVLHELITNEPNLHLHIVHYYLNQYTRAPRLSALDDYGWRYLISHATCARNTALLTEIFRSHFFQHKRRFFSSPIPIAQDLSSYVSIFSEQGDFPTAIVCASLRDIITSNFNDPLAGLAIILRIRQGELPSNVDDVLPFLSLTDQLFVLAEIAKSLWSQDQPIAKALLAGLWAILHHSTSTPVHQRSRPTNEALQYLSVFIAEFDREMSYAIAALLPFHSSYIAPFDTIQSPSFGSAIFPIIKIISSQSLSDALEFSRTRPTSEHIIYCLIALGRTVIYSDSDLAYIAFSEAIEHLDSDSSKDTLREGLKRFLLFCLPDSSVDHAIGILNLWNRMWTPKHVEPYLLAALHSSLVLHPSEWLDSLHRLTSPLHVRGINLVFRKLAESSNLPLPRTSLADPIDILCLVTRMSTHEDCPVILLSQTLWPALQKLEPEPLRCYLLYYVVTHLPYPLIEDISNHLIDYGLTLCPSSPDRRRRSREFSEPFKFMILLLICRRTYAFDEAKCSSLLEMIANMIKSLTDPTERDILMKQLIQSSCGISPELTTKHFLQDLTSYGIIVGEDLELPIYDHSDLSVTCNSILQHSLQASFSKSVKNRSQRSISPWDALKEVDYHRSNLCSIPEDRFLSQLSDFIHHLSEGQHDGNNRVYQFNVFSPFAMSLATRSWTTFMEAVESGFFAHPVEQKTWPGRIAMLLLLNSQNVHSLSKDINSLNELAWGFRPDLSQAYSRIYSRVLILAANEAPKICVRGLTVLPPGKRECSIRTICHLSSPTNWDHDSVQEVLELISGIQDRLVAEELQGLFVIWQSSHTALDSELLDQVFEEASTSQSLKLLLIAAERSIENCRKRTRSIVQAIVSHPELYLHVEAFVQLLNQLVHVQPQVVRESALGVFERASRFGTRESCYQLLSLIEQTRQVQQDPGSHKSERGHDTSEETPPTTVTTTIPLKENARWQHVLSEYTRNSLVGQNDTIDSLIDKMSNRLSAHMASEIEGVNFQIPHREQLERLRVRISQDDDANERAISFMHLAEALMPYSPKEALDVASDCVQELASITSAFRKDEIFKRMFSLIMMAPEMEGKSLLENWYRATSPARKDKKRESRTSRGEEADWRIDLARVVMGGYDITALSHTFRRLIRESRIDWHMNDFVGYVRIVLSMRGREFTREMLNGLLSRIEGKESQVLADKLCDAIYYENLDKPSGSLDRDLIESLGSLEGYLSSITRMKLLFMQALIHQNTNPIVFRKEILSSFELAKHMIDRIGILLFLRITKVAAIADYPKIMEEAIVEIAQRSDTEAAEGLIDIMVEQSVNKEQVLEKLQRLFEEGFQKIQEIEKYYAVEV